MQQLKELLKDPGADRGLLQKAFQEWKQRAEEIWSEDVREEVGRALEEARQKMNEESTNEMKEEVVDKRCDVDPQNVEGFLDAVLLSLESVRGRRASTRRKAEALAKAIEQHRLAMESESSG